MTSPKSPISPEERARAACTEAGWLNPCAVPCKEGEDCDCEKERSVIAQAIRQAENDVLEWASQLLDDHASAIEVMEGRGVESDRARGLSLRLRGFKHKDTP